MAWEQLPWNDRILQLEGLSDDEKARATNLVLEMPSADREAAVPRVKTVALSSLRDRLAKADGGKGGAGGGEGGGEGAGSKKRAWDEETWDSTDWIAARRRTTQQFRNSISALTQNMKAPTSFSELEAILASEDEGLIPVTADFFQLMQQTPEGKSLVIGCGPVAAYMTAAADFLMTAQAGPGEQKTAVEVSSWLFSKLYFTLLKHLRDPLRLEILLNRSTTSAAKSSLSSPIMGLKRPDIVVMSERKVSLVVVEEKPDGELQAAIDDVRKYLDGGLPVGYQWIQGIPVAAVAGCAIKFGFCDLHGTVTFTNNAITINTESGAIQALAAALKVYSLLPLLHDRAPKALTEMGLGGVLKRPNDCSIEFGSRTNGITKIIDNFSAYQARHGVTFEKIEAAYKVKSPFLPEIKKGPSMEGRKKAAKYYVQMLTFGMKLPGLGDLEEAEAARCVYACLCVARELHAGGICAADFRWQNMMRQQKRALPAGAAPNPAYEALETIPLVIDLELARAPGLQPPEVLQSWEEGVGGTLQPVPGGEEDVHVYTTSSDVYQIGVMLELWKGAHPHCSPGVPACVAELKSHTRTAAYMAQRDPWLDAARTAFAGLV